MKMYTHTVTCSVLTSDGNARVEENKTLVRSYKLSLKGAEEILRVSMNNIAHDLRAISIKIKTQTI